MAENNNELFSNSQTINSVIVPFGKHKGKPVEALAQDRQYCDWLLTTDWFRDKHQNIYQIIINNFGEPSSTPEHNALQARFLNDSFCLALANLYRWKPVDKNTCLSKVSGELRNIDEQLKLLSVDNGVMDENLLSNNFKETFNIFYEEEDLEKNKKDLLKNKKTYTKIIDTLNSQNSLLKIEKTFESNGWDVILNFRHIIPDDYWELDDDLRNLSIGIEIKPSLGDDYPAILRQMKSVSNLITGGKCLVYDKFYAKGATLEQIKQIFSTANFGVLSITEIDARL